MTYTIQDTPALSTSEVSALLGFGVSIAFLESCGSRPIERVAHAAYWAKKDFPIICAAIAERLTHQAAATVEKEIVSGERRLGRLILKEVMQ